MVNVIKHDDLNRLSLDASFIHTMTPCSTTWTMMVHSFYRNLPHAVFLSVAYPSSQKFCSVQIQGWMEFVVVIHYSHACHRWLVCCTLCIHFSSIFHLYLFTGQSIEPTCYVPIIPMALVNGSEGIGTGKIDSILLSSSLS
jgi:DNA gyrase/topoisomerase IV, subunit A